MPWYKQIQPWLFHMTLEVQLPADQSYVAEVKRAQTSLALSGKAVSNTTTYNPSNLRGKYQHLICAELYYTGIRRSQIQMGIRLAISFGPCSTTGPSSYLDLFCPTPFLLLFSCCLTGVWISQPGQI